MGGPGLGVVVHLHTPGGREGGRRRGRGKREGRRGKRGRRGEEREEGRGEGEEREEGREGGRGGEGRRGRGGMCSQRSSRGHTSQPHTTHHREVWFDVFDVSVEEVQGDGAAIGTDDLPCPVGAHHDL